MLKAIRYFWWLTWAQCDNECLPLIDSEEYRKLVEERRAKKPPEPSAWWMEKFERWGLKRL